MQRLSFALFILVGFCSFIGVGYAHSSTGNEKLYKSEGPWTLLVGSCQLKVKSAGTQVAFEPIGNSSTEFVGQLPQSNAAVPVDISTSKSLSGGTLNETLHVEFAVDSSGAVYPSAYHLSRSYKLDNVEKQAFETNCGDLK